MLVVLAQRTLTLPTSLGYRLYPNKAVEEGAASANLFVILKLNDNDKKVKRDLRL